MALPVALQLYTVRDVLSKDLDAGLAQIKEIGFDYVEIAGLYGRSAEEMKSALEKYSLTPVAAHEGYATSDEAIATAAANAKVLGYKYVIQPYWPDEERSEAGYGKVIKAAAKAEGLHADLKFGYHNHDFEFDRVESGRTGYEVLFEGTNLIAEMDSCWVAVGGDDIVEWMQKLAGRLPLLHIKDCSDFAEHKLAEVGTGKVPLKAAVDNAEACAVEYLVVEQDNNWIDGDPMKSAKISYDNLMGMLA